MLCFNVNAKFITASSFESQNVTYSNGRSFKKQKLEQKKHHENPAVLTFISPEINKLNFKDRKKASPKDIKIFEKKIIAKENASKITSFDHDNSQLASAKKFANDSSELESNTLSILNKNPTSNAWITHFLTRNGLSSPDKKNKMFIIGNTNENSEEEKRDQDANHIASNEERECNQNISIKGEMCELKNFEEKGGLYTTRDREHDDKSPRNFPTNTSLNNINQNTSKPILLYDFPGFGLVYTSN